MTRPHAVVFDLDDTLFDHTGSAADAVAGWVTELGGATPSDELLERWFAIETTHFDAWLAGRVSHQEQRRLRLRDFLPLLDLPVPDGDADGDAALDASYEVFLDWYQRSWRAFADARPALEVARGDDLRVGVLTNGSTTQQNAKLAAIGLAGLVDAALRPANRG